MLRLAFRNLFQKKARLLASVGGVALALSLIVALDAIFTGVEGQLTAYIDNSGADVIVSQSGVRTMHMSSSWFPAPVAAEVKVLPGVESVTAVLYATDIISLGQKQNLIYVFGLPPDPLAGKPWRMAAGMALPGPGEAVLDQALAKNLGLQLGDKVTLLGQEFKLAGLSEGTSGLVSSITFISAGDFARIRGKSQAVSFLLVKIKPGQSSEAVASRIETEVKGITAQTRAEFAYQERKLVKDMGADVITIMNLIGFVVGLAVTALTVYLATFSRRAEYGVLKALGASNNQLYRVVLLQTLVSVALGLVAGVGFTLLLSVAAPGLSSNLTLQISGLSLLKVSGAALIIAGLSALLPVRQIAGLDPALVFKRGVK